MTATKKPGAANAGLKADELTQNFNTSSAEQSQSETSSPDDGDTVVTSGRETKGFLRPHGREFEIYAADGESFTYVATGSRTDAVKLLREHASCLEACR